MSRRRKSKEKRYEGPNMPTSEWRIRNYLFKNDIYPKDYIMQTIIINSFGDETLEWKEQIAYINQNFGAFAMYAQNNWKHKQSTINN